VILDYQGRQVLKEQQDKDCQEIRVRPDWLDHLELLDLLVHRDLQVLLELLGHQDQLEVLDLEEIPDRVAILALQDFQVNQLLARQDHRVLLQALSMSAILTMVTVSSRVLTLRTVTTVLAILDSDFFLSTTTAPLLISSAAIQLKHEE
jgi:hypothetical protein